MGPDCQQVALGIARQHRRIALPQQALEPINAAVGRTLQQTAQPWSPQQRPLQAAEGLGPLLLRKNLNGLQKGFHSKGSRPGRRSLQLLAARLQRVRVGGLPRRSGAPQGEEHHRRVGVGT